MKTPRPYVLQENNWKDVKDQAYTTAVLPWGATEAHNYHLPYGTDNYLAEAAAIAAAAIAWEKGARPVVLPVVPFGVNTGQLDVPLCINMNPSTQLEVLKDIVQVLDLQNIDKLVIVNAHGGNTFKPIIRELSALYPKVFVCALNWWRAEDGNQFFDDPGDHAGELETSAIMHLHPELVLPLDQAGDGEAKTFKIQALSTWVTTQRKWTSVTKDTGVGDPSKSTAEKGAAFFKATTQTIGDFLVELHQADTKDLYQ
ncbi:creatininase family protein [Galbibacter sp.]|uniref:creatininase family protein n=1 Tax=Galbibacter sp. TaxID=2918471 RepID=UPI003A916AF2